ncbi:MAG: hypothetical protein J3R72DRAFT_522550 [Linnemannia gamsii]|nr:MAG: hypothetical protein J3R72DRAFT_522550 [Linnemannia gamsii]
MAVLLPYLQRHWPCIFVVSVSLYTTSFSLRGGYFRQLLTTDEIDNPEYSHIFAYTVLAISIAIDLQRIHVAFKPSTRTAQFAFNLWLVGATVGYFFVAFGEILSYFVPLPKNNEPTVINNESTTTKASIAPVELASLSSQLVEFAFHMLLGFGLKTILNQRRLSDLQQEHQWHRHHHLTVVNKDLPLPTPVASASSAEGFKTEAELHRLRLRVPTWPRVLVAIWFLWLIAEGVEHVLHLSEHISELTQAFAGFYVLYHKSLILTQWLFYSICASTAYQVITTTWWFWKLDHTDILDTMTLWSI